MRMADQLAYGLIIFYPTTDPLSIYIGPLKPMSSIQYNGESVV